ncbi:MAG: hypothetical protein ACFFHV_02770 [Promethearchaeota archaeon]
MTEEDLNAKIVELEEEFKAKERELYDSYDRIDQLEETIMKLESCLEDENIKDSKKKKSTREVKLEIELEEKVREIRDLKNRMGILRKEKTQTQRELEKYTKVDTGTVIRIEEKKQPLEILVKDLNDKIRKQDIIIRELKQQKLEFESDNLKKTTLQNEEKYNNLKKLMDYKNEIISELIKQMQNHKSLISDSQIQSRIKRIEELNEKISKHISQT